MVTSTLSEIETQLLWVGMTIRKRTHTHTSMVAQHVETYGMGMQGTQWTNMDQPTLHQSRGKTGSGFPNVAAKARHRTEERDYRFELLELSEPNCVRGQDSTSKLLEACSSASLGRKCERNLLTPRIRARKEHTSATFATAGF